MLMGLYYTSQWLYDNPPPTRPAYNISGKEPALEKEEEIVASPSLVLERFPKSGNRFSDKKRGETQDLERFAEPSEAKTALESTDGARLFRQCASCHTVNEQGANRVGPSLWNIVNRPVASLENYRYSRALQELGQSGALWDEQRLDAYLSAPAQAVVGTSMAFRGLTDKAARAAIIAYLRTLVPHTPAPQEGAAND